MYKLNYFFTLLCLAVFLAPITVNTNSTDEWAIEVSQVNAQQGLMSNTEDVTNQPQQQKPPLKFDGNCAFGHPNTWLSGCLTPIFIATGSLLVVAGATVMDVFMHLTLQSEFLRSSDVQIVWATIRDLANLTFILGIIFVAMLMITNIEIPGLNSWKKTLIRLIIVALLLNFSLFFSRAVIDVGNIMGLFFYQTITKGAPDAVIQSSSFGALGEATNGIKSPGATIVKAVGIDSLLTQETVDSVNEGLGKDAFWFSFNLVYLTSSGVVAWSLLKSGFMMLSRMVWLLVLSVSSPLALVLYFLPWGDRLTLKWIKSLFDKTFCVCVYLFFIYLLIMIISGLDKVSVASLGSGTEQFSYSSLIMLIVIKVVIVYSVLRIANNKAQDMCEGSHGIGSTILKTAVGAAAVLTTGGAGLAARASLGRAGRAVADSKWVGKLATSDAGGIQGAASRSLGQVLYSSGEKLQDARFGRAQGYKSKLVSESKKRIDRADALVHARKDDITSEVKAANPNATQGVIDEKIATKMKETARDLLKSGTGLGVGSSIDFALAGGVAAGREAYDSYKVFEEGDLRKKRERAQQIAERSRMSNEHQNSLNTMDSTSEALLESITDEDHGITFDKRSIADLADAIKENDDYKNMTDVLKQAYTQKVVGTDGKIHDVFDQEGYSNTLGNLNTDLQSIGERLGGRATFAASENKAAKERVDAAQLEVDNAPDDTSKLVAQNNLRDAKDELRQAQDNKSNISKEVRGAAKSSLAKVQRITQESFKAKLSAANALSTAMYDHTAEEASIDSENARTGDVKGRPIGPGISG